MQTLCIHLFGRLHIRTPGGAGWAFRPGKGQDLLAYLLLQHPRVLSRESLASVFWANVPTSKALRNLRQALWQVRVDLEACTDVALLRVDDERVSVNQDAPYWLDVACFREIAAQVEGVPGHQLTAEQAAAVERALGLYTADLLEGCAYDWCIYEREYLQRLCVILLDKMIGYCQRHVCYEAGIQYGERILRYDRAHERTHRRLMYLHCLAGDRTAALRQFARCADALREELDVEPTGSTSALHEQIRADRLPLRAAHGPARPPVDTPAAAEVGSALAQVLERLQQIYSMITISE